MPKKNIRRKGMRVGFISSFLMSWMLSVNSEVVRMMALVLEIPLLISFYQRYTTYYLG
jgi:hypothetical protein